MAHGQCSISNFWMNEWMNTAFNHGRRDRKEDTDVRDNIKFLVKVEEDGI